MDEQQRQEQMRILSEIASKTALTFIDGMKEIGPSKNRSWVCGAVCGAGCSAGCGGGCVAGCQADGPLLPVTDVYAAGGAGGGAGGVATGAAESY